jgi:hypothetical protein
MDQDLFNTLAINIAWMRRIPTGDSAVTERAIHDLLASYRRSFTQDQFVPELMHAVDAYNGWLLQTYPTEPEQSAWFGIFRHAVEHFEPNGKRKRRPLFNGTWFTAAKMQPPDRFARFMKDLALYFVNVQAGKINNTVVIKGEMSWGLLVSLPLALLAGYEASRHHSLFMAACLYLVALSFLRLADLWALRRRWSRWKRAALNVALAFVLQGVVLLTALETCNPQTMTCRRVFF